MRHLFLTGVNYLFTDLRPKGAIETLELEDESLQSYGAATVPELTWKDIHDPHACTACRRCQDHSPAWETAEERIGSRISETRVAMAVETAAPVLVSNCPLCLTMFEDGIKAGGFEGRVEVRDLAEIVAQRLAPDP